MSNSPRDTRRLAQHPPLPDSASRVADRPCPVPMQRARAGNAEARCAHFQQARWMRRDDATLSVRAAHAVCSNATPRVPMRCAARSRLICATLVRPPTRAIFSGTCALRATRPEADHHHARRVLFLHLLYRRRRRRRPRHHSRCRPRCRTLVVTRALVAASLARLRAALCVKSPALAMPVLLMLAPRALGGLRAVV